MGYPLVFTDEICFDAAVHQFLGYIVARTVVGVLNAN